MAQEDSNVIDQPEVMKPRMVSIEISGKKYDVPEGITVIKALWYTGQEVVRGAGCLGGFCGACATYYRTKDDPKVRTCLACQTRTHLGIILGSIIGGTGPTEPAKTAGPAHHFLSGIPERLDDRDAFRHIILLAGDFNRNHPGLHHFWLINDVGIFLCHGSLVKHER